MPGAIRMIGLPEAKELLEGISARLADPTPLLEATMQVLELGEVNLFERLAPHFMQTGATRASLTQPDALGAIREIHGMEAKFGTSIWYAGFLRKVDGPSGKPRGRKRVGGSLVLKTRASDRHAALAEYGSYILRGT